MTLVALLAIGLMSADGRAGRTAKNAPMAASRGDDGVRSVADSRAASPAAMRVGPSVAGPVAVDSLLNVAIRQNIISSNYRDYFLPKLDPNEVQQLARNVPRLLSDEVALKAVRDSVDALLANAATRFELPNPRHLDTLSAAMLDPVLAFKLKSGPVGDIVDLASELDLAAPLRLARSGLALSELIRFRDVITGLRSGLPYADVPFPWDDPEARQGFAVACNGLSPRELLKLVACRNEFTLRLWTVPNATSATNAETMRAWDSLVFGAISQDRDDIDATHRLDSTLLLVKDGVERLSKE